MNIRICTVESVIFQSQELRLDNQYQDVASSPKSLGHFKGLQTLPSEIVVTLEKLWSLLERSWSLWKNHGHFWENYDPFL